MRQNGFKLDSRGFRNVQLKVVAGWFRVVSAAAEKIQPLGFSTQHVASVHAPHLRHV